MRQVAAAPEIDTPRLRLRGWREADIAALAEMNADPDVMAHLGGPESRRTTELTIGRFVEKWREEPRFGWWAVERREDGAFLGLAGLGTPDFVVPPAPCVEIGWRFARAAWGQGYATEAAQASLAHAFATVGLEEVLAFTVPGNRRSVRVMERIGMVPVPGAGFQHPFARGETRFHTVHRRTRTAWEVGGDG